jgi:hypothetical protein
VALDDGTANKMTAGNSHHPLGLADSFLSFLNTPDVHGVVAVWLR